MLVGNRTFETDKDGRLIIYPSLYAQRPKGICRNLMILLKSLIAKQKD